MKITALNQFEIETIYKYANLKPKERLFFDYRNQEMTYEDIAEELDCSVKTVQRLAKKTIAKCVKTLLYNQNI